MFKAILSKTYKCFKPNLTFGLQIKFELGPELVGLFTTVFWYILKHTKILNSPSFTVNVHICFFLILSFIELIIKKSRKELRSFSKSKQQMTLKFR